MYPHTDRVLVQSSAPIIGGKENGGQNCQGMNLDVDTPRSVICFNNTVTFNIDGLLHAAPRLLGMLLRVDCMQLRVCSAADHVASSQ